MGRRQSFRALDHGFPESFNVYVPTLVRFSVFDLFTYSKHNLPLLLVHIEIENIFAIFQEISSYY